jgi:tetratricopeptide (TPR) repeat protein
MPGRRVALVFACGAAILGVSAAIAQDAPSEATASRSSSASPAPSLSDAEHLYRTGKFDAAIQEYQTLSTGPQAAMAYVGLERAYLRQKRPSDAYAAATKAADLAPRSPDVQVALGEAYFRQGKIPEAESEFVAVINSGAKNARAYLGLARVSQAASLYRRAKDMIDRAHSLDPADPDVTRFWMARLTLGERIKALHDYLAEDTDDDPEARTALERQLILLQGQPIMPVHQCRMVSTISSTQTDFKQLLIGPNLLRGYGLDVKVNGSTSHLLLDTGADGILVDRKVAEKAGIKPIVSTDIRGVGDRGPAGGYVAFADSIEIGELKFRDCYVQVIDKNSVIGEDGLIGGVVFSQFLVDLDFPNEKFRLSQLPPRPDEPTETAALESGSDPALRFHDRYVAPEMRSYWPVFRFGHMLLIPTKLNDSDPKLFLIDTGAFNNIISPEAAREVTRVSGDPNTRVNGLNGEVKNVFRGNDLKLTFANMRQENQDIVALDTKSMSDGIGTEISGTLGFAMLRMLDTKIDYRDGLVSFTFDANRWR